MKSLTSKSSSIALFSALAAFGYAGSAFAVPSVADNCRDQAGSQTSQVLDAVENRIDGRYDYGFRVCNTSAVGIDQRPELIRDWELPWFGDNNGINLSDIENIVVPEGWDWTIEEIGAPNGLTGWEGVAEWQTSGDEFNDFFNDFFGGEANNPYNDVTHVLHFFTCSDFEGEFGGEFGFCAPIAPGDSLEGFGFDSSFGSTNAPYQASWIQLPVRTGDPQFPLGGQPLNPIIRAALPTPNDIPEPGSLAMLGLGLGALAARRKRKTNNEA